MRTVEPRDSRLCVYVCGGSHFWMRQCFFFFGDRGYWLGWVGDKCLVVFSRINFTFVNNYRGRINMNES